MEESKGKIKCQMSDEVRKSINYSRRKFCQGVVVGKTICKMEDYTLAYLVGVLLGLILGYILGYHKFPFDKK